MRSNLDLIETEKLWIENQIVEFLPFRPFRRRSFGVTKHLVARDSRRWSRQFDRAFFNSEEKFSHGEKRRENHLPIVQIVVLGAPTPVEIAVAVDTEKVFARNVQNAAD